MKSYTKWYHYFLGIPLIAVTIGIAWIVITVDGFIFGVIDWLKRKTKQNPYLK